MITRTGREKPFLKMISPKQLNLFFLNTAIFYINNINLMAKDILIDNDLSICITYPDISFELHNLYSFIYLTSVFIDRNMKIHLKIIQI